MSALSVEKPVKQFDSPQVTPVIPRNLSFVDGPFRPAYIDTRRLLVQEHQCLRTQG